MGGKWRPLGVLVGLMIFAGGTTAAPATSGMGRAAGTLNLSAELRFFSTPGSCPPGVAASTSCLARTGEGIVPGLGGVAETYTFLADIGGPPTCAGGLGKALAYPAQFAVAGKGEIRFALAEGAQCVDQEALRAQTQAFTVTGGTGIYQGASGSGTVERVLGAVTATGRMGRETWTGILVVPGLEFDLTRPTLTGAVGKTVRAPRGAKSVRVAFRVTAQDDVDGSLPVMCTPRSGSRFKLGKSRVTCSATDASGNAATARFTITVRARR